MGWELSRLPANPPKGVKADKYEACVTISHKWRALIDPVKGTGSQSSLENRMACRNCGSDNQQRFSGELTASLPDFGDVNVPPVYVCQEALICLNCGFLEMQVPSDTLELLRKKENRAKL